MNFQSTPSSLCTSSFAGRLQSVGSRRVRHDWATSLFTFMHWRGKWQSTPVFLPGEIPGTAEPDGLPSVGSLRVGHDWSDLAAAAGFQQTIKINNFSSVAFPLLGAENTPLSDRRNSFGKEIWDCKGRMENPPSQPDQPRQSRWWALINVTSKSPMHREGSSLHHPWWIFCHFGKHLKKFLRYKDILKLTP